MPINLTKYYEGLSSKRFFYRKLTPDDVESWMEFFYNNPSLPYLDFDLNRPVKTMSEVWIGQQLERYTNNTFGQLAIVSKQNNHLVGLIGYKISKYCGDNEIEKMTAIKPTYWRQGIGKEVNIILINAVFENDLANAIIGIIHIDNVVSRKYNTKFGFEDECIVQTGTRKAVKIKLTKKAWKEKRDHYYPEAV